MNKNELIILQSLPLDIKIMKSKRRIIEAIDYFGNDGIYVSVSGGLDSTVLSHIVEQVEKENNYKHIPRVLSNTGNEYDDVLENGRRIADIEVKPKMTAYEVWKNIGYPVGSKKIARMINDLQNPTEKNYNSRNLYLNGIKQDGTKGSPQCKLAKRFYPFIESDIKVSHKCCDILKKEPLKRYEKESGRIPLIGTMADEGGTRTDGYIKTGCNAFEQKKSMPIGFWTKQDILQYILDNNLYIPKEYGEIKRDENNKLYTTLEQRTGCFICMFGLHLEKGENRFQRMKRLYPKKYNYAINVIGLRKVLDVYGIDYE